MLIFHPILVSIGSYSILLRLTENYRPNVWVNKGQDDFPQQTEA